MKNFSAFLEATQKIFKERLFLDYLRRFAYGIDASCYRYIPKAVIWSESEEEIRELIKLAYYFEIPLTFRAAGTSLSGQASSENVLVICHKEEVEVGNALRIAFLASAKGTVIAPVNLYLKYLFIVSKPYCLLVNSLEIETGLPSLFSKV